ncbi:hypothetical protein L204_105036 [Cryptococcus depauperatus]|nr:hypothetical protein L204_03682 [Cryptococcus depauperatus CBS 7855]
MVHTDNLSLLILWAIFVASHVYAHPTVTPLVAGYQQTPQMADILQAEPTSSSPQFRIARRDADGASTIHVDVTPTTLAGATEESSETETATKSYNLVTATTPIPLAATLGLIMPNPWQALYTDLNYTFGFVDAVSKPAPTFGGWLREVQPLFILSNYDVHVLPSSGTDDPTSSKAVPVGSDGLCGATVENSVVEYPFKFEKPGWYMFVVNQTYMQANVTSNNQCTLPILQQKSFFATQSFSIASKPTYSPGPVAPTSAYTVWAQVSTHTPSSLPYSPQPTTSKEKLAIALGSVGAVLGLACIVGAVWWVRKRRQMKAELLAFSRLSLQDQEAFLRENPKSFLNPQHPRYASKDSFYDHRPPAPPGTMAYAMWHSQQMWNNQVMVRQNPMGWRSAYGTVHRMDGMRAAGTLPSQWGYPQQLYNQQQQPLMYGQPIRSEKET